MGFQYQMASQCAISNQGDVLCFTLLAIKHNNGDIYLKQALSHTVNVGNDQLLAAALYNYQIQNYHNIFVHFLGCMETCYVLWSFCQRVLNLRNRCTDWAKKSTNMYRLSRKYGKKGVIMHNKSLPGQFIMYLPYLLLPIL